MLFAGDVSVMKTRKALPAGVLFFSGIVLLLIWMADICSAQAAALEMAAGHGSKLSDKRSSSEAPVIRGDGQTVTVRVADAPLRLVLAGLARQSGINVWISPHLEQRRLSENFSGLPVAEALRRILRGTSYFLVYGREGDGKAVTGVHVLASASRPVQTAGQTAAQLQDVDLQSLAGFLRRESLPVGVREALLHAISGRHGAPEQDVAGQRPAILAKLLMILESGDAADSAVTRKLRELLEHEKTGSAAGSPVPGR